MSGLAVHGNEEVVGHWAQQSPLFKNGPAYEILVASHVRKLINAQLEV